MEEENKSEAKTISLPKKVWELMDKLADKTEISRSSLIQIALFNFITKELISLNEEKMKSALGDDYDTVNNTVNDTIKWLDDNKSATTEEYESKQKEVEDILMPLVQKAYQANMPQQPPTEPKVDEV
jgi:predicted transcriptional regulator